MTEKLETLTPEQEALIPLVRDEWLDRFFNPKPANLAKMEAGARWLYNLASLPEPLVLTTDSPYSAQIVSNVIPMVMNNKDCILAITGDRELATWAGEPSVPDGITPEIVLSTYNKVVPYIAEVLARLGREKGNTMLGQVLLQASARLIPIELSTTTLKPRAVDVVYKTLAGQKLKYYDFAYHYNAMDYHWVAFYEFFTKIGVVNHEPFNIYNDYLKSGVYESIQLRGMCTMSLMPTHIHRDTQNRLHSVESPAIAWQDGYKLYYVNGVYFPEDLYLSIMNGEISAKEVLKLDNAEQKTIAIKQFGYDKLLKEVGSRVIDSTLADIEGDEPKVYELLEADLGDDDVPARFVKVVCHSTKKEVLLRIDPRDKSIKDAQSAIAWTFNLKKSDYKLDLET